MKKLYGTFVNETAKELDTIIVSAGKIGYQVEVTIDDLVALLSCNFANVVEEK